MNASFDLAAPQEPKALVLPLAFLEDLWLSTATQPVLAHGTFALQDFGSQGAVALAGRLSTQALEAIWHDPRTQKSSCDGVLLVYVTPNATPASVLDEHWLLQLAPAWRNASPQLRPPLAVLWMSRQHMELAWRSSTGTWRTLHQLDLPGSRQRSLQWAEKGRPPSTHSRANATGVDRDPMMWGSGALLDHDRGSRQREALGAAEHDRTQTGRCGVVGLGRTGAPLVISLVRMGVAAMGIDTDILQPHNFDSDFSPLHEGWSKARSLSHSLASVARPGAAPDMRMLSVSSPAAGALLAQCDLGVFTCADNDDALLWAGAIALATHRLHICIASGLSGSGGIAELEIRVLLPGRGCPLCVGGFSESLRTLRSRLKLSGPPPSPVDFRQQRTGSLRSWSVLAGHHALRCFEHVLAGRLRSSMFRRLIETTTGGLEVQDTHVSRSNPNCPLCKDLLGAGLAAVTPERLGACLDAAITQA